MEKGRIQDRKADLQNQRPALLAIARSHATLTKEELHWKSVFPNTPMPKVLKDILPPPGQSTIFRGSVSPDSDGVNDPEFGAYWYDGAYDDNSVKGSKAEDHPNNKGVNDPEFGAYGYDDEYNSAKESRGHNSDPNNKGVNDPEFGAYGYDYEYKDSAKESRGHDSDPNNKGVNDPEFGAYGYDYEYKDSAKEPRRTTPSSKGNKNSLGRKSGYEYDIGTIKETIYFFQEDLRPGKKMNLKRLTEKSDKALFLPQQIAESMPVSTDKLPEILKNFSIKPDSIYAKGVGVTVMNCERAEMRGEEKYCATSLESFVDLGVAMFGKNIRLLSHQLGKGVDGTKVNAVALAIAGSHSTLTTEELHWKSVFPKTPMPKVLKDILPRTGQSTIFRGDVALESEGAKVRPPVSRSAPNNKGVNDDSQYADDGYDSLYKDSIKGARDGDVRSDKDVNDDSQYADDGYDSLYKDSKESRGHDNAPNNKGINDDSQYADDGYDSLYKDSAKGAKDEDVPSNKGVNDDSQYADDGYDSLYEDLKESRGHDNAPNYNKGVNDDSQYADDGYNSLYNKDKKNSRGHDNAPENKGINDDSLYKDSAKGAKDEDVPSNKGVNDDSQYADDGYDSLYKDSAKGARDEGVLSNKDANDPPAFRNQDSSRRNDDYDIAAIKETMYFLQDDLRAGRMMNLQRLAQKSDRTPFLPQQIAQSIPISTDKLPVILKNFSIKAESSYGKGVRITVMNCERAEMRGEEKYCATSLESFVDLGVAMLGKNIRLLSHQLGKGLKNPLVTINRGMRDMGENNIVCHKTKYPYAVFLCHSIKKTTVYDVPLVGVDGTKVNAVAVCHKDTSAWSPNHIAFKFLKVKPGTVPICHFLRRDAIAWVRD
ncbi:hypothetical protein CCACVL1_24585 [Corchorus capsularis]|uniref:BURP domain-containing protein n=1 Tax=Corchorus capsularis TaxID=210143 RepID=A0A1R3GNZ5_COCAP|nr:hypothetical protein CCACVL1_24585 [Corchorus capsularis]